MQKLIDDEEIIVAIQKGPKEINEAISWIVNESGWRDSVTFPLKKYADIISVDEVFFSAITAFYIQIRDGKFKGESNLKTYLGSICKYQLYTALNKEKKYIERYKGLEFDEFIKQEQSNETAIRAAERQEEIQELVKKLIDQLDERCRSILIYKTMNYSVAEIAGLLDLKKQTIKNNTDQCRKKLRTLTEGNEFLRAEIDSYL